jgi:hypothetical protein
MQARKHNLCKTYARLTLYCAYQYASRSWNNFLCGIFPYVLKLFQSWNIIPATSVNDGISIFQLFQAASTKVFHDWNIIPIHAQNILSNGMTDNYFKAFRERFRLRKILYNFDFALHVWMGLAMICILANFGERECKGLARTNQAA